MTWLSHDSTELQNPDVKSYAAQFLGNVEQHANAARALNAAPTGDQTADRIVTPAATVGPSQNGMAACQSVYYGTVSRFEPGQVLELKMRHRIGLHVYTLANGNITATIPEGLKSGAQVTVVESVDSNGLETLQVQRAISPNQP